MARPTDKNLLSLFDTAKLTSAPYAYAIDPTGKTTAGLILGDPMQNKYRLQITDADWIDLQAICGNE